MTRFPFPMALLIAILLLQPPPTATAAEWIETIPATAKAAIIVRNAADLEKGVRAFAAKAELPTNELPTLAALAASLELGDDWQPERGAAVIAFDVAPESFVILLPVADERRAIGMLNAVHLGQFFKLTLADVPLIAIAKPKLLCLARSRDPLRTLQAAGPTLAEKLSPAQRKLHADSNLFIHVDVAALRMSLTFWMSLVEQKIVETLRADNSLSPAARAFLDDYIRWSFSCYQMLIDQTATIALGGAVNAERAIIRQEIACEPNSELARIARDFPKPAPGLLAGLPSRSFTHVLGHDNTGLLKESRAMSAALLAFPSVRKEAAEADRANLRSLLTKVDAGLNRFNAFVDANEHGFLFGGYFLDSAGLKPGITAGEFRSAADLLAKFYPLQLTDPVRKESAGIAIDEVAGRFTSNDPEVRKAMAANLGEQPRAQTGVVDSRRFFVINGHENPVALLRDSKSTLVDEPRIQKIIADLPSDAFTLYLVDPVGYMHMLKRPFALEKEKRSSAPAFRIPSPPWPSPLGFSLRAHPVGFDAQLVVYSETIGFCMRIVEDLKQRLPK